MPARQSYHLLTISQHSWDRMTQSSNKVRFNSPARMDQGNVTARRSWLLSSPNSMHGAHQPSCSLCVEGDQAQGGLRAPAEGMVFISLRLSDWALSRVVMLQMSHRHAEQVCLGTEEPKFHAFIKQVIGGLFESQASVSLEDPHLPHRDLFILPLLHACLELRLHALPSQALTMPQGVTPCLFTRKAIDW